MLSIIKCKLLWTYLLGLPMGVGLFWLFFYFEALSNLSILFYRGLLIIGIVCIVQIILFSLFLSFRKGNKSFRLSPHAISVVGPE